MPALHGTPVRFAGAILQLKFFHNRFLLAILAGISIVSVSNPFLIRGIIVVAIIDNAKFDAMLTREGKVCSKNRHTADST